VVSFLEAPQTKCEGGVLECYSNVFLGSGIFAATAICGSAGVILYQRRNVAGRIRRSSSYDDRSILARITPSTQSQRDRALEESRASRGVGSGGLGRGGALTRTLTTQPLVSSRATGAQVLGGARTTAAAPQSKGTAPPYATFRKQMLERKAAAAAEVDLEMFTDLEEGNVDLFHQSSPTKGPPTSAATPSGGDEKECQICLSGFGPGDQIRVLPCMHTFHKPCVDEWLALGHNDCPLCKQVVNDPTLKVNSEFRHKVEQRLGIDSSSAGAEAGRVGCEPRGARGEEREGESAQVRAGRRPIRQVMGEMHEIGESEVSTSLYFTTAAGTADRTRGQRRERREAPRGEDGHRRERRERGETGARARDGAERSGVVNGGGAGGGGGGGRGGVRRIVVRLLG